MAIQLYKGDLSVREDKVTDAGLSRRQANTVLRQKRAEMRKRAEQWKRNKRLIPQKAQAKAGARIRAEIGEIYARDWKPRIDYAAQAGEKGVAIIIRGNNAHGLAEKMAVAKFGVRFLRRKGYGVTSRLHIFTHIEKDGSWEEECFQLHISW